VNGTSSEKLSKVNVLTVLDAKGLEFDSVIINDESMYNLKIEKEVKMLYVAVTRAIFELNILTK
jgi:DNA helicase IV